METMTVKQAMEIVKQTCAAHVGRLQEHVAIQDALKLIEDEINKIEIEKKG